MDTHKAINSILSQIKSIDPDNACKILGYILLRCHSDQDLLDFALSPQSHVLDVISNARFHLGISSNTLPAPKNTQNSSPLADFSDKSSPDSSTGQNSDSLSRFGDTSAGNSDSGSNIGGFADEDRLGAHFSFLDDCAQKNEEILDRHSHRAESDGYFRAADGKIRYGFRPCVFFATRGFCRNGDNCRLAHRQQKIEPMRMNAAQQQRLEGHSGRMGESSVALMGDEVEKFGQVQPERNDSLAMATEEKATRASKSIYLTFSPGSSFKDSDVSDYFSTFGPVQDVKIPYRENRTFGFVEFVHSETVKAVLSRPNPHLICGWPVFAKPYKEKGKVSDNSQRQQHLHQQLIEGGNYSPFSSPSGTEMLGQEPMVRKMLEQQAELQQAFDLQWKRLLINLQIPNSRGDFAGSLSTGSSSFLPPCIPIVDQNQTTTSDFPNFQDNGDQSAAAIFSPGVFDVQNVQHETSSSETKAIDSHKGDHW